MLKRVFVLGIALTNLIGLSSVARAELVMSKPINVTREVAQWVAKFGQDHSSKTVPVTECAETVELRGAYLCQSLKEVEMNKALARAAIYVEAPENLPKGKVVSTNDPVYQRYLRLYGGHDLKGIDLMEFYDAANAKCKEAEEYCLNNEEKELFEQFVVPTTKSQPEMVVITFASRSNMGYEQVVTHEIMHAQYFLDPEFAQVVDFFWMGMSEAEKNEIRGVLSSMYNPDDEFLIKNEFQAYILMAGAEDNQLGGYVDKYRSRLQAAMKAAGVTPIQVQ